MDHYVRYAKPSACGVIRSPGWRLRLFATSNEADAFSQEMIGRGWRIEIGALDQVETDASSPTAAEPSFTDELAELLEHAASLTSRPQRRNPAESTWGHRLRA